jgi:hypothetical protein
VLPQLLRARKPSLASLQLLAFEETRSGDKDNRKWGCATLLDSLEARGWLLTSPCHSIYVIRCRQQQVCDGVVSRATGCGPRPEI